MSAALRIFWLVVMVIFVGGCSGYQKVGGVRVRPEDPYHDILGRLDNGDMIRLTLDDGTMMTGKVTGRTINYLTIEVTTEPLDRQEVQARRIFILEKEGGGQNTGMIVGVVVGVVLIAVVVGAIVASSVQVPFDE